MEFLRPDDYSLIVTCASRRSAIVGILLNDEFDAAGFVPQMASPTRGLALLEWVIGAAMARSLTANLGSAGSRIVRDGKARRLYCWLWLRRQLGEPLLPLRPPPLFVLFSSIRHARLSPMRVRTA